MEKIWVGVETYQLIIEGVHLFRTEQEAKDWFESYTGLNYDTYQAALDADPGENLLDEDYDQTKIFESEVA